MKIAFRIMLVASLVLAVGACTEDVIAPQTTEEAANDVIKDNEWAGLAYRNSALSMGDPSGASTNSYYYWNYQIDRNGWSCGYHRDRGTPNWVSWHLGAAWLGGQSRSGSWKSESKLPSGWPKVYSSDYTNSGFDRGHNTASADRSYSSSAMSETYYMSNVIPQAPNQNQQVWRYLEEQCRSWANQGYEMYIVMGNRGTGGTGRYGYKTRLNGKVTVPQYVWKAILRMPEGSNDTGRPSSHYAMAAVWIPNSNNVSTNWRSYKTTVNYIESQTGYNLFANLPNSIENSLEASVGNL